jgi:hypothetical protein
VRILVTGSRDWDQWDTIVNAIEWVSKDVSFDQVTVVHGGAHGADSMADEIARGSGVKVEIHYADWKWHGARAGLIRNQEMVDAGADVCLAFIKNNSRGASHCANAAERAGIPVRRYTVWE